MSKKNVSTPVAAEITIPTVAGLEILNTPEQLSAIFGATVSSDPTTDDKPAFEQLPWKPLTVAAYEASQAHIGMNHGKSPMAMKIWFEYSRFLGRPVEESEYYDIVRIDKDVPETHLKCAYPGCKHDVPLFRTALVLNGEISKDRNTGETIWRGNFLVMKPAGRLAVEGFCYDHIFAARAKAEELSGKRQHPMPYAEAVAKLQGILEAGQRHRNNVDAFESRYGGSFAQRSAPRNSGTLTSRR